MRFPLPAAVVLLLGAAGPGATHSVGMLPPQAGDAGADLPVLRSGSLEADVGGGPARVRLVWRFSAPVNSVTLTALLGPGQAIHGLDAGPTPGGVAAPGAVVADGPAERFWTVDAGGADSLVVLYMVGGPGSGPEAVAGPERGRAGATLHIPVVLPEAGVPASVPGVFSVDVGLPGGVSVRGGFPSGFEVVPDGDRQRVQVTLPVLPRIVALDLVDGPLGPMGRIGGLESTALLLILVSGAWGWRRMTADG